MIRDIKIFGMIVDVDVAFWDNIITRDLTFDTYSMTIYRFEELCSEQDE